MMDRVVQRELHESERGQIEEASVGDHLQETFAGRNLQLLGPAGDAGATGRGYRPA